MGLEEEVEFLTQFEEKSRNSVKMFSSRVLPKLLEWTTRHFEVDVADIQDSEQSGPAQAAYYTFVYLARKLTSASAQQIANLIHRETHSSVMNVFERVKDRMRRNERYRDAMETMTRTVIQELK